ncbi:MAG: M28 family peptidase [Bacteroidetes bacterium]|nr:M28 family peptidase [Bacteroidota bacterium]
MKNFFTHSILYLVFVGLFFVSCNNETKQAENAVAENKTVETPHITPPNFDADSAYVFVKAQADMGPRTPGSKAHEQAAAYFEKKFKEYGAEVIIQKATVTTFDEKKWLAKNVVASFNLEKTDRVLLCAHWDSRPFCDEDSNKANLKKACPGVNDGASGAGILIEVARALAKQKPNIGIDIILWDMEDYGQGRVEGPKEPMEDDWALGSQYWSKNPHKQGYTARFGILLDLVGTPNVEFPKEQVSLFYASQFVNKIWNTAYTLGYGNFFVQKNIDAITDDHLYINKYANIPCVDIIGYDVEKRRFFPQHHTLADDLNLIDKKTLKAVGQTVLEVIYNER